MNKRERRAIESKVLPDVSELGQITKEQLLRESEQYDKDNYDPLADIADKVVIRPFKEREVITVHLTQEEDSLLIDMAKRRKISPSALIKVFIAQGLEKQEI
ncbi:MAG TPA: hypothetical protein VMW83_06860 [Spirochaetia bacterium]|nr:hypothetical protein [Spirochaetia bacterium]